MIPLTSEGFQISADFTCDPALNLPEGMYKLERSKPRGRLLLLLIIKKKRTLGFLTLTHITINLLWKLVLLFFIFTFLLWERKVFAKYI